MLGALFAVGTEGSISSVMGNTTQPVSFLYFRISVTRSHLRALRLSLSTRCSKSGNISRMVLKVLFSEDPAFVLTRADEFLSSEPVLHNLILSILHSRVAQNDPGRYWIAFDGEKTVGAVVQSPLEYPATLTPMEPRAVAAIVNAIAEAGVALRGVNGNAATAASFAGQWSERCKSAATPFQGMRLYELLEVGEIPDTEGQLRQAGPRDRSLMILWTRAFQNEIGESAADTELRVDEGWPADNSGFGIKTERRRLWPLAGNRCKAWFVCPGSIRHPRNESTATRQPAFMLCLNIFAAQGIGAFSIPTWVTPHRIPFTDELGIGP